MSMSSGTIKLRSIGLILSDFRLAEDLAALN